MAPGTARTVLAVACALASALSSAAAQQQELEQLQFSYLKMPAPITYPDDPTNPYWATPPGSLPTCPEQVGPCSIEAPRWQWCEVAVEGLSTALESLGHTVGGP